MTGQVPYLSGLLLGGRRVVVVGGGRVAARRVPKLLAVGAKVTVVSPSLHPDLQPLAADGALEWEPRGYASGDLAGAWYVIAATSSPSTNAEVAADADQAHTFCVRSDSGAHGSAWTPATGEASGLTIGVVGRGEPRRSQRARDRLLDVAAEEGL